MTPAEDVANTARIVLEEARDYARDLVQAITACLLEMPHKLEFYCSLLQQINGKDSALVGKVLGDLADCLDRAIALGNWRHLVQGVRAILELQRTGILDTASVEQLVATLTALAAAGADDVKAFVCWCLLANLRYMPAPAAVLATVLGALEGRRLPADLADLVALNSALAAADWAGTAPAPAAPGTHQLTPLDFGRLVVDPAWDPAFAYTPIFPDTFEPTEAPAARLAQWTSILHMRQALETFELNHPKMAEVLLAVPAEAVGHPEKMVAELLFGEMLRPRRNGLRQILFEVVLMDCCRITRLFPPVMARALLALVARLEALDTVQRELLAAWFAHHLSNFDFKWKWDEWQDIEAADSPRRRFVVAVLERLVRLSYHDRVAEALPAWAQAFLPPVPEPAFPQAAAGPDAELAAAVLRAIQERSPADALLALLAGSPAARRVFVGCLLTAGCKTFSHTVILIERYLPVLQHLHPKHDLDSRLDTIQAVADVWASSPQHREFVLERLTHYRVVSTAAILAWTVRAAPADPAALSWPVLATALAQSRTFPLNLQSRIDAAPPGEPRDRLADTQLALQQEHAAALQLARAGLAELAQHAALAAPAADMLRHVNLLY